MPAQAVLTIFFTTWVRLEGAHDEPLAYEVKFKAVVQTLVEIASQDIHHASVQDLNNSAAKLDKMCKLIEDAIHDHVSTFDMNDEKRTNMAAENRAQIHRYKGKMRWLTKPSGACPSQIITAAQSLLIAWSELNQL